jgi:ABC-type glycerol-3-phosphate transport system permease component
MFTSKWQTGIRYGILFVLSVVMLVPFAWMVITAFKTPDQVFYGGINWLSNQLNLANFAAIIKVAPFFTFLMNTLIVVCGIASCQLILVSLAAYAFARLNFWGSDLIFILFTVQIMLPLEAIVVPNYFVTKYLGLLNTRTGMILPFIASGYGTFMLRQAFKQVPLSLEEAARIDGCGHLRLIRHVLIPLAKPTVITYLFISIVSHWNDYFWPLIITDTDRVRTLPLGLGMFVQQEAGADWTLLMAATLFVCAPVIVIFISFQQNILNNFLHSGIKG